MELKDSKIRLGLIINPISGMGGSVGLKGTDGEDILNKALKMGAIPNAPNRAKIFLEKLTAVKTRLVIITPPGVMGGDLCEELGFETEILDSNLFNRKTEIFKTTQSQTENAAKKIMELNAKLLVFVGGDGTARNVLNSVDQKIACLGIPSGVKIHSSVFSINPETAAQLTLEYLWGEAPLRESEVLDINEEEFRNNRVVSKLYGYLLSPYSPLYTQPSKMASPKTIDEEENKQGIAKWLIEEMDDETYYLVGPGTTTKPIADQLKQKKTLLGVDLLHQKKMIGFDLNEQQILEQIGNNPVKLIVTPIGRQGFVFGRGNLQFSSKVLERVGLKNIIIVCTKYKLESIPEGKLRIDTRDPNCDAKMKGLYRILVDYGEYRISEII